MKSLDSNLQCPSCQQALRPQVLVCGSCDIRVEGPFHLNEFATLSPEDLHFLRIFVHSEGRIRDMEASLGLSYPTIRARLSALKARLAGAAPAPEAKKPVSEVADILSRLEAGELSFDQAMQLIRQVQK